MQLVRRPVARLQAVCAQRKSGVSIRAVQRTCCAWFASRAGGRSITLAGAECALRHLRPRIRKGGSITAQQLARTLRLFGIFPRTIRFEEETLKGYYLKDCQDAFSRYLD